MNPIGVVIVFLLSWWMIFFAVLPLGVRGRWESDDDGVVGADPGAPVAPDLRRKALITAGIAAIATIVICAIGASGVLVPKD